MRGLLATLFETVVMVADVASLLPLAEVPRALAVLEKYLIRLTRLDTP